MILVKDEVGDDDNDAARNYKGYATSKYSDNASARGGAGGELDDRSSIHGGGSSVHGGGSKTARSATARSSSGVSKKASVVGGSGTHTARSGTLITTGGTETSGYANGILPARIDVFSDLTLLLPEPTMKIRNFELKQEDVYVCFENLKYTITITMINK